MAEDKICNILYCMAKHNWREALHKSGRTASNTTVMELEEYNLKQKGLETIVVDDNSNGKKSSIKNKGKAEPSTKKVESQMHIRKISLFWETKRWEQILCAVQTVWQC
eukprot:5955908-Ditylum_brightwellii.AAC.1